MGDLSRLYVSDTFMTLEFIMKSVPADKSIWGQIDNLDFRRFRLKGDHLLHNFMHLNHFFVILSFCGFIDNWLPEPHELCLSLPFPMFGEADSDWAMKSLKTISGQSQHYRMSKELRQEHF
ncbi:hypothetical protein RJT34_11880 [Clitoria ternatea]|uniref:Uncharacterized protein n=1 Tax=Clitoria ternatea TaxID=43366 RepID=A0AAN9PIU5_CLITE